MFIILHYYTVGEIQREIAVSLLDISTIQPIFDQSRQENLTRIFFRGSGEETHIDVCEPFRECISLANKYNPFKMVVNGPVSSGQNMPETSLDMEEIINQNIDERIKNHFHRTKEIKNAKGKPEIITSGAYYYNKKVENASNGNNTNGNNNKNENGK